MSAIPYSRRNQAYVRSRRTVKRKAVVQDWTSVGFVFVVVLALSFGFTTMLGQMMAERASQSSRMAEERYREAVYATDNLRRQIDSLSGIDGLDMWAEGHGYLAPDQLVQPSYKPDRVATNF